MFSELFLNFLYIIVYSETNGPEKEKQRNPPKMFSKKIIRKNFVKNFCPFFFSVTNWINCTLHTNQWSFYNSRKKQANCHKLSFVTNAKVEKRKRKMK